jgi:choline transport protein
MKSYSVCFRVLNESFELNSEAKAWHTFLAYQIVNLFCFLFNCYGKLLPAVGHACLYTSLVSFFVIMVAVPAKAPMHQPASFVFATFINSTGWANDGLAFIVGLINANWGFSCLDTAVHLAEEIQQPEKMIPIAIMGVVGIGLVGNCR